MVFWGLEVKPGKPQSYDPKVEQGKVHVTQATLGQGLGKGSSVIQCSKGDKTPIYLCSLLPNKTECCPLNLEFDDDDETVEFSVTGDRSIHLSGYLEEYDQEDDDSDGIDIGETESDESSDYDSEEEQMDEFEDFLDSNLEMYRQSSAPNSGVVIEEIEDEEKPAKDNKAKRPKKKSQASKDENANKQIIVKESANAPVLESEDEDGFPIPKGEAPESENRSGEKINLDSNKKRKAKASEQDGVEESLNKNKKKKNQKEKKNVSNEEADEQVLTGNVLNKQETSQNSPNPKTQNGTVDNAMNESSKTPSKSAEKKNKKKNKNLNGEATVESKSVSSSVEKPKSDSIERNQVNSKASQERTYPNGLIVEELAMGKPDGKKATPGKQVSVRYIGKLQKNGKIFDSNIGKAPFKFRLGVGQVIKGWDVGVNGMRVGDKRKLTIPPAMGYGARGAGGQIPPNAWLTFDVELMDVK
ncbi:hypothetical protein EUTSA_v10025104mg [Eutrema salsugineum]|uniref:FK506-binding protein n=1 Tax=Eutrema salsugineum TaxID=72664 RepID=V4ME68_EUTSA|nr:peptidyl-prolyl cis-trans isomerase FKBP53 [Eutrema salsugineum]ESQ54769.1 hypothetical protein EUTSA_v10025104mg [Eutrema salsugineum]